MQPLTSSTSAPAPRPPILPPLALDAELPCELDVDFTFRDDERDTLYRAFLQIEAHPYRDYPGFMEAVRDIAATSVPPRLAELSARARDRSPHEHPFVVLRRCPIDPVLPIFDHRDPVADKHGRKLTYVAEAFLALYSVLLDQPPIGYVNVNAGDVFQDIYLKESMRDTQSQKTMAPIWFHKDLANHFVRPDVVNILGLRSCPDNLILTSFVRNKDVFDALDDQTLGDLERVEFYTPFDDLTVAGDRQLGRAADHPVISGVTDVRFFENRTVGLTDRAQRAVERLTETLHAVKRMMFMQPGDFVSIHNNDSVHGKEVRRIGDPAQQRLRWSIKTVNVYDLAPHAAHMVPGHDWLVDG